MREKLIADNHDQANANLYPGATYGLAEENGEAAGFESISFGDDEPKQPAKKAAAAKKK